MPFAIPDNWTANGQVSDARALETWLKSFRDPKLAAVVHEAIAHNFDLQATAARLKLARAQARIAGAPLLPEISARTDAQRGASSASGARITGPTLLGPGAGNGGDTFNNFDLLLEASWEIDIWGRLRAARDAARQDTSVAAADLAGARLSLAARTAQSWFDVIEARMQADLAKTQLARRRQVVDLVRGRFQRGIGSGLELRLALTESAFDESRVAERENQLTQARRRLEALLGRYPSGQINGVQDLPPLPGAMPTGLPSQLLGRRPDLIAALTRLRAADLRVRAAELDRLPRLTLNGTVGTNSDTIARLADPAFLIWNIAGGLVQPVFTGGRLTQQIKLNQARAEEELARYRDTAIVAFREVEDALTAERRLSEQERSLAEAAQQAEASVELAQYSYRNGLVDILFLLQSLQSRLDTRSQHLAVRRQLLNNRIDLFLALGGDFDDKRTPLAQR